ncbi:hypothetical protein [Sphingomonas sp. LY160]|uniref:hypothetical protein n=1 Tax=Sphingomonas sp. LY160 TaxID=3095342 RepID=UPI002ADEDA58|nr:hypothetical protein [Sphingomonas sp. LY160]MEA1071287.1 hypothetical protein [Sphingomonas sp. LY160]
MRPKGPLGRWLAMAIIAALVVLLIFQIGYRQGWLKSPVVSAHNPLHRPSANIIL